MRRLAAAVLCALTLLGATPGRSPAQGPRLIERNLLTSRYNSQTISEVLVPFGEWHPLPDISEREAWEGVAAPVRKAHIAAAESLLSVQREVLTAGLFLEFVRNGNRTNYQQISFDRRERLATMVIAELLENEGRFLDDIVDGIWLISEETFWGVPAHLDLQTAGFGLPDVNEPAVDLFAAETGALLSWTLYLLGERLDDVSPLVAERIRTEVRRRIIEPTRNRDDFWWMGFDPTVVNNWTPWVGSNWLASLLLIETDRRERAFGVYKVLRTLDTFLNSYADDGGCDEGPGYWSRAGGSLLDALEILHTATDGSISIYDEPLVQEMARFIYRAHVGGPYFINFADAAPRVVPDPAVMLQFGKRIGDDRLKGFAGFFSRLTGLGEGFVDERFGSIFRQTRRLLAVDELTSIEPVQPLIGDVWLADIEVMAAREEEGSSSGFYLAAKAGHNGENHNHNDVGNFIVYENGRPVLIDVGPGTYTRTTFSSDRYTLWNFQSDFHNVPSINGVMQQSGSTFKASDVVHSSSPRESSVRMELAGAYPENAGVTSWKRSIALNRVLKTVTVRDDYQLSSLREAPRLNLMTFLPVEVEEPGIIRLTQSGFDDVLLTFDPAELVAVVEPIVLEDDRLRAEWGNRLIRLILVGQTTETTGSLAFTLQRLARL